MGGNTRETSNESTGSCMSVAQAFHSRKPLAPSEVTTMLAQNGWFRQLSPSSLPAADMTQVI